MRLPAHRSFFTFVRDDNGNKNVPKQMALYKGWSMNFFLTFRLCMFFWWATARVRIIFEVKHRTWIVESACSIVFFMVSLARYIFFQPFSYSAGAFLEIAHPPHTSFRPPQLQDNSMTKFRVFYT